MFFVLSCTEWGHCDDIWLLHTGRNKRCLTCREDVKDKDKPGCDGSSGMVGRCLNSQDEFTDIFNTSLKACRMPAYHHPHPMKTT